MLGFKPHRIDFYRQALSHKSLLLKDKDGQMVNNERLEFLGDAIIEAVVSDIVFHQFEHEREGFLTTTRSKLVRRSALNQLSSKIGLDNLIRSSMHSEAHNCYIGGNAFEALIGAIYLDRGYDRCQWFIRSLIKTGMISPERMAEKEQNFKSRLLEWSQKYRIDVRFESIEKDAEGGHNMPLFISHVIVEGRDMGVGRGYSKKESHQNAARKVLERMEREKLLQKAVLSDRSIRQVVTDNLSFLPEYEKAAAEVIAV